MKSNEGIAIRTTVARFTRAVEAAPEKIMLGRVQYLDYSRKLIEPPRIKLALSKRREFAHEREVRAIVHKILSTSAFSRLVSAYQLT